MSIVDKQPLLGAHVSVAGGVHNGLLNAKKLGADVVQIHASSPRRWEVFVQKEESIKKYKELKKNGGVKAVFLHAPYLINLVTTDEALIIRSEEALTAHMRLASQLGAEGVVVHMGSFGAGGDKDAVALRAASAVKKVLKNSPDDVDLLLENASGNGGKFGVTAEEIGGVIKKVGSARLRTCIDTAHAFGAGLLEFTPEGIEDFFEEWEREAGKGRIALMHVNDSKVEFGSFLDRHENLGKGHIGLEGFSLLAADEHAKKVPWVLEVPGFAGHGPDKKNMEIMRSLFS